MMLRLLAALVLLCACGAAAPETPLHEQPPLCIDLRAFAESKVSPDNPCPPARCTVFKDGVNCETPLATAGPADDNGAVRACTSFYADGITCEQICPPVECKHDASKVEVCDNGSSHCGTSNLTCYVLRQASDCPPPIQQNN